MIKQQAIRWFQGRLIWCALGFTQCVAGAVFQNLDFQAAKPQPRPGTSLIPIGTAMPGWRGFIGSVEQTQVDYHSSNLGSPGIELRDNGVLPGGKVNYSALFYSGGGLGAGATSLSQSGEIPLASKSMLYETATLDGAVDQYLLVSINGSQQLSVYMAPGLAAVDVSAYAGQEVELRFTAPYLVDKPFPQVYFPLDNVRFSSESVSSVPEPGSYALLLVGGVLLVSRLARSSRT